MPHLATSIADYDYSLSKTLYGFKIYSEPLNLAPQNAHRRTLAASLTILHLLPSTVVQPNFFQSPTLLYALSPESFTYAGFFTWNTLLTLSMWISATHTSDLNLNATPPGSLPWPHLPPPPPPPYLHYQTRLGVPAMCSQGTMCFPSESTCSICCYCLFNVPSSLLRSQRK